MKFGFKTIVIGAVVLVLIAAVGGWQLLHNGASTGAFRTVDIKRGDIQSVITATGTLEPEEVVDVGAQVTGIIDKFGTDEADGFLLDYRSEVEAGQLLAHIDDTVYQSHVLQAKAQLETAKAGVQKAAADLNQMKAKLNQSQRDWDRAQKVGPSEALSQNDYDMYEANYETARANVGVGDAALVQAQQAVPQADAVLLEAQRNFDYCTIKSPVKGIIIDRRVNIGQTIVSNQTASSMFLIAKDLKSMQVWASVNEADVANVYPGQPVTFTCDALAGESFTGQVRKVRPNAQMTQNVVTFTVEVTTDNSSARLVPYLTANVQFQVAQKNNVLLVPNAALRWYPQIDQVSPEARDAFNASQPDHHQNRPTGDGSSMKRPSTRSTTRSATKPARFSQGTLWVQDGKFVKPIRVQVGITDGLNTEVRSDDLKEGMQPIIGEIRSQNGDGEAKNPFAPQFPGRQQQKSGSQSRSGGGGR